MIGLREKVQENHGKSHISWENLWFLVDFPLVVNPLKVGLGFVVHTTRVASGCGDIPDTYELHGLLLVLVSQLVGFISQLDYETCKKKQQIENIYSLYSS